MARVALVAVVCLLVLQHQHLPVNSAAIPGSERTYIIMRIKIEMKYSLYVKFFITHIALFLKYIMLIEAITVSLVNLISVLYYFYSLCRFSM